MQYTQGHLRRVFVAHLEEGESMYEVVEEIGRRTCRPTER